MCVCVDLAQQIVEAGDFLLQVLGLDDQLVANGLGLLLRVQREDKLHGGPQRHRPSSSF